MSNMKDSAVASRNHQTSSKLTQETANKRAVLDMLEKYKKQIEAAIPKHLTPERLIRLVTTSLSRNPKLLTCSPASIFGATIQASQLGLEPGILGQAHFVPYYNGKNKHMECQFVPGYQGLVNLAQRSGEIKTIHGDAVRANDEFDFRFGSKSLLTHRPALRDRGEIIAFYAYAETKDGGEYFEVMSIEDMEEHRDKYTKSKNRDGVIFGTWVDEFEKMAIKTMLIQVCKLLPKSIELQQAIELDNLASNGVPQGLSIDNLTEAGDFNINQDYDGEAEETKSEVVEEGAISEKVKKIVVEIGEFAEIKHIMDFRKDQKKKGMNADELKLIDDTLKIKEDELLEAKQNAG